MGAESPGKQLVLWSGVRRERAAFFLWWGAVWFAESLILLYLLRQSSPQRAVIGGILLLTALLAPIIARWSLRPPTRAKHPAPPAGATYAEWMPHVRAIGRFLYYQEVNGALPPNMKSRIHAARLELASVLKAHPLSDDLERISQKLRGGIIAEWKAFRWEQCLPELMQLGAELERQTDADPFIRHQNMSWRTAHHAIRLCMPSLLASDRLQGELACMYLGAQTSENTEATGIPEIFQTARFAIEWCDFSNPWQPAEVIRRCDALPLFHHIHGATPRTAIQDAPPTPPPTPVETPPTIKPEPAPPIPPEKIHQPTPSPALPQNGSHHHRHRHRRRRRSATRSDIRNSGRILGAFFQRIRYTIHAWFLYR